MSHSVPPSNGRPLLEPLEARLLLDATLPGQNEVDPAVEAQVVQFFEASPAVFVENQGQWADESVRYRRGARLSPLFGNTRSPWSR